MRFLVVIPVKNGEKFIVDTLNSIYKAACLSNKSEVKVSIRDAKSTDNTLNKIKQWYKNLECKNKLLVVINSDSDGGMYEAIAKDTHEDWSDIFSYLGCGDVYEPETFLKLETVFSDHKVKWITGRNQSFDPRTKIKIQDRTIIYRPKLIQHGVYGYLPFMPVIQQESTFWRSELWKLIDVDIFSELSFAGDFFLWINFAKFEPLYSFDETLAAFTLHGNHKSHLENHYRNEMLALRVKLPLRYLPSLLIDQLSYIFNFRYLNESKYVIQNK